MENLTFGFSTTLVGMSLVFGLLALLWALLALLARLDRPAPEEVHETAESVEAGRPPLDPDAVAAITIALITHTVARRRQAAPEMRTTLPGSQIYASRWLAAGRTRQTLSWQPRRN